MFLDVKPFSVADTDGDGVIQQALPRTAAVTGGTLKWNITVKGPDGGQIGAHPGYAVPSQAADTLLVP